MAAPHPPGRTGRPVEPAGRAGAEAAGGRDATPAPGGAREQAGRRAEDPGHAGSGAGAGSPVPPAPSAGAPAEAVAPAGAGAPPPGAGGEAGDDGSDEAAVREALVLALGWLGLRARTEQEITRRLRDRGVPEPVARVALARLRRWGYVDDRRLAQEQVEGARVRHIGPRRVRAELMRRGVPAAVVDAVVAEAWPGDVERDEARRLARRRWAQLARRLRPDPAQGESVPFPVQGGEGDGVPDTGHTGPVAGSAVAHRREDGRAMVQERRRAAGRVYRYLVGRGFSARVAAEVVREVVAGLEAIEGEAGGADPADPLD